MSNSGYTPDNKNLEKSSGTPNLHFNIKNNILFERNKGNIAYEVTSTQVPAMVGGAVVDLHLTKGHIREPHWHPNAWELDIIISGEAIVAILNPDTAQLQTYHLKEAGDIVFIPMGWWHWITAKSEKVHMLLFFNNDQPENAKNQMYCV